MRTPRFADLALRLRDNDPSLLAVVLDAPELGHLVSAAVGFLSRQLCTPGNPRGWTARLSSLATWPEHRGHGYATAVTRYFVDEARMRGCREIRLNTSPEGAGIYRRLGFGYEVDAMRLDL